jgi:hypothetical protein
MPFRLVKGTFRPGAGTPDGDSVRFAPDDPDLMRSIPGVRMPPQATTVQLRYEGIDTLEKHAIQPHANRARDMNLKLLGTQGASDQQGAPGFILTREGDKKSGRPICFVYAGSTDKPDGKVVRLEPEQLPKSVNHQLLKLGLAYPLFYETLFKELRDELVVALKAGRQANPPDSHINLDQSRTGFEYTGPNNLAELPPIFPKLFRRLDEWNGDTLDGFILWLEQNDNERVFTLSDGRFIGFQDALEVVGNKIRMLYAPEDMVFRPKPFGPPVG